MRRRLLLTGALSVAMVGGLVARARDDGVSVPDRWDTGPAKVEPGHATPSPLLPWSWC